jgi:hypothetical protein
MTIVTFHAFRLPQIRFSKSTDIAAVVLCHIESIQQRNNTYNTKQPSKSLTLEFGDEIAETMDALDFICFTLSISTTAT